jgi:16S rRNA (adenine1518-N6/adenine1519-N6)-dimethyltransferase
VITPKKSLGQNFLADRRIARRIVDELSPSAGDLIIEIGPGTGALTSILAATGSRVVAIEIDQELVDHLASLQLPPNVNVVKADALKVDWNELVETSIERPHTALAPTMRVRIVANMPYYAATPIVERLITSSRRVFDMTLMLQNEVVERIVASPGSKAYGYLSILVQYRCLTEKLFEVPPSAFYPVPKIWSAVMRLTMREEPAVEIDDEEQFFGLVRAAFAQRRKTIANNLKAWLGTGKAVEEVLATAGVDSKRRAETISIEEFAAVYISLQSARDEHRVS